MSAKQRCVHHSKTCCLTLKHFDKVFATGGNNFVEVLESLTKCFWMMDTPLFSGHFGAFDTQSHLSEPHLRRNDYRGFEPRSNQAKDFEIGICCFSAKHAALSRKNTNWLALSQDIVPRWNNLSTCEVFELHIFSSTWQNTRYNGTSFIIMKSDRSFSCITWCKLNHIGGTMVSMLASPVVDLGFYHQTCQTKLRSTRKDWFALNLDNVYKWSNMSTRGMLF